MNEPETSKQMVYGTIVEILDPLVIELVVNRYGLSTQTDKNIVRSIEQEIILAALRIQKKSNRW